ncbi:MAG: methylenetetrahydrofolate reductase C-terminal domain-containing protein [Proteobacteria bacterium]|nr:methylenetetrahydrofolate reductase C-terminal domain-containing protein [Pseudomonadota bacterium]
MPGREGPSRRRLLILGGTPEAARLAHGAVFDSESLGFKIGRAVYRRVDRSPKVIKNIFHAAEQATKVPVYGCKDCGDCSLPDIAYLCPESQCVKNQRNGPCGGTHDGYCEVLDKECIWSRAYDRLKAHGEEERMLERPVVFKNGALQGTSAWANTFLGRDHNAAGKDDDSRRPE